MKITDVDTFRIKQIFLSHAHVAQDASIGRCLILYHPQHQFSVCILDWQGQLGCENLLTHA